MDTSTKIKTTKSVNNYYTIIPYFTIHDLFMREHEGNHDRESEVEKSFFSLWELGFS